jgi:hypothetical protein
MTPPPPVHTFIHEATRGGRCYRMKAICSPSGIQFELDCNFDINSKIEGYIDGDFEAYAESWRCTCMDRYLAMTGLSIEEE